MKVALYARVSDDKKKDDGSRRQDVQGQLEVLRKFALQKHDKNEVIEYVDDGKSAFTEDFNARPRFKQLILDVRRSHVKQIYIEDMTRFSRNLSMGLQWLKELGIYGCNLTSLKEGEFEATSSQGWLKSSIILMFSEWESRIRSEKVKRGMDRAREQGKNLGRHKTPRGAKKTPPFLEENAPPKNGG